MTTMSRASRYCTDCDYLTTADQGRARQALLINGLKPSDPAGDERAVQVIREMANLVPDSGAQFLLYPHTDFWLERIEDCVRVADQVDRPDVGVMFNLCHWLRVSKDRDYTSRLKQALPRLMMRGTLAQVSTLLSRLGLFQTPHSEVWRYLGLGSPTLPSRAFMRAVDSPETKAPAPL